MTITDAEITEQVEQMAKAMFEAEHAGLSNCYEWDDHWEEYQEVERDRYYKRARAMLPFIEAAEARAREEGAKAMQEAAINAVPLLSIRHDIRALDPAQIAGGGK